MASLYDITVFFSSNPKLIKRGEVHLKSSHLQSFNFDPENEEIHGRVQASLRDEIHSTRVRFRNGTIDSAYCSCRNGNYRCSHMATLLLYSVNNISSTDQPCTWNKPKEAEEDKKNEKMFVSDNFTALQRKPDDEDRQFLQSALSSDKYTGVYWLLSPEPTIQTDCPVLSFDDLMNLCEGETLQDRVHFIIENLKVTENDVQEIYSETIGQRTNYLWGQFRKGRITSSNFGLVLSAVDRACIPPSLLKTLKGEYHIENVKAVQWGIIHEKTAKKLYEEINEVKIKDAGLFLHESGILGCSPDGTVGDKILEIKCPFSKIDSDLLKITHEGKWFIKFCNSRINGELREKDGVKVYIFEENEVVFNLKNKQGNSYYHQVQGMLHIMKKENCDFLIWSPKMSIIFNIKRDQSWLPNLQKLIHFYQNVFIYTFFE